MNNLIINSTDAIKALMVIINKVGTGVPFYASDIGVGNYTNSLRTFLVPTGNTRKEYIDLGDDYCKRVEAKEWILSKKELDDYSNRLIRDMKKVHDYIESMQYLLDMMNKKEILAKDFFVKIWVQNNEHA